MGDIGKEKGSVMWVVVFVCGRWGAWRRKNTCTRDRQTIASTGRDFFGNSHKACVSQLFHSIHPVVFEVVAFTKADNVTVISFDFF